MDPTNSDSSSAVSDSDSDPEAEADVESVIEPDVDPGTFTMARQRADAQVAPGADPNAVMNDTVHWYVDVLVSPSPLPKPYTPTKRSRASVSWLT